MKVHKIAYLVIISTLFFSSSCTKWLDIKPESEMVLDDFWQTESQAKSVVASCYKSLTTDDCMSRMILWGEGRSDNIIAWDTDDDALKKLLNFDLDASNKYCTFGPFYTVINYCNTFLYYAPGVLDKDPNFTRDRLNSYTAEVLTIRSLVYFYLVRAFKSVPWINQPSTSDQQNFFIPQSSERAILDSIINNLHTALSYAPTTYGTTEYDKGRITKNAVMALLADIYLWDMQYENCVQMCNQIMADKSLQLTSGQSVLLNVFYQGNSSESIFELQFGNGADNKQVNNMVAKYYGYAGDMSGQFSCPLYMINFTNNQVKSISDKSPFNFKLGGSVESTDDIRQKDFIYLPYITSIGSFPIFKYSGFDRLETSDGSLYYIYRNNNWPNWIVYRLSDVMLMKAEALVQLNRSQDDLQQALDLVNTTYQRSNYKEGTEPLSIDDYQSQDAMERLVLRERQRELLFEGKRWFDLERRARRTGTLSPLLEFVSQKLGQGSSTVNSNSIIDALYLPINKGELESNPELKQNPYYDVKSTY